MIKIDIAHRLTFVLQISGGSRGDALVAAAPRVSKLPLGINRDQHLGPLAKLILDLPLLQIIHAWPEYNDYHLLKAVQLILI